MGFTLSHRSLVPALFALAILSMPAPALAATDNQLLDRSACAALIAGQAADAISSFEGDVEGVKREARLVFEMAKRHDDPGIRGEFSVWLRRAGDPPESDDTMAASYALQMRRLARCRRGVESDRVCDAT